MLLREIHVHVGKSIADKVIGRAVSSNGELLWALEFFPSFTKTTMLRNFSFDFFYSLMASDYTGCPFLHFSIRYLESRPAVTVC